MKMQIKRDIPNKYGRGSSVGNGQERDIISRQGYKIFSKYP
jgi:hypothetical protein